MRQTRASRGTRDDRLLRELEFHVEEMVPRLCGRRHSGRRSAPARAARIRRARSGQRGMPRAPARRVWLDDLWRDLLHGFRLLRSAPGFAAVAIATLAVGIGANTAVFSLVHTVLLAPLPVDHPEQLVVVSHSSLGRSGGTGFPYQFFRELDAERQSARRRAVSRRLRARHVRCRRWRRTGHRRAGLG